MLIDISIIKHTRAKCAATSFIMKFLEFLTVVDGVVPFNCHVLEELVVKRFVIGSINSNKHILFIIYIFFFLY